VLDAGGNTQIIATCDAQVEGKHFIRGTATPREIGHKVLAVNLSDIAAMGAEPAWVLVSLVLPPDIPVEELDGIYAGMRALAGSTQVSIVGGNIASTSGPLTIDITVLGLVERGHAVLRSGARAGDRLIVTGALGGAAAGVLAFTADTVPPGVPSEVLEGVRQRMVAPTARVAAGHALGAGGMVHAMIDISDGLAADLGHLCDASGVGAILDANAVPVDTGARTLALAAGRDPLELALAGGEDYELLFAVAPAEVERALEVVRSAGDVATVIGSITEERNLSIRMPDGGTVPLERRGWDHLRG
jgi:thiamine-monophosphate kinase